MRKLAILLLIASPLLTVIGMAGCVASIASIGNTSRQMTPLEVFGLLGAPILFVVGVVLLIVDWRRRRHIAADGGRPGIHKPIEREPGGVVGAAVSITQVVVGSSVVAIGWGLLGLALNTAFLIWAAKGLKNTLESDSITRYIAAALMCLLACMPVGYAILAWKVSIRRRLGQALRPYEDSIMKAVEGIVVEYVETRTTGSSRAATLATCIQRVASLPEPVKAALGWFLKRAKLSNELELATGSVLQDGVNCATLAPPAIVAMRSKLDESLFNPRKGQLTSILLVNLVFFVLLAIVTQPLLTGVLRDLSTLTMQLLAGLLVVTVICLKKHPATRGIRDLVIGFFKFVMLVLRLLFMAVTGGFLISRKRSQKVRWVGYALIEAVYGLVTVVAGTVLCGKLEDKQSHLIVPAACAAFLIPSLLLFRWIKRTGISAPVEPERKAANQAPDTARTLDDGSRAT